MRNQESTAARGWSWKLSVAIVVAGLALSAIACSTDDSQASEAELAAAALQKGLDAHAAGDLPAAAAAYREVIIHDPNNQYAYYNLGVIDQANGSLASADSNYSLALSIDPAYVPALYNLAIVKTAEDDIKAAIDLYRKAIDAQPDYAAAHLNLGFALLQDGQRKKGKAELAIAVDLDPSLADRIPEGPASGEGGPSETASPSGTP
jgi:tetratricopeptide (TPR) repeat protein